MKSPLLTVTVTNYNYGKYIGRTIESILCQTFRDFEVIIVDNASTDESIEVIKSYMAQDDRIRLIAHEKNEGLIFSIREACNLARGQYRVHVDADDWVLDPQAFELQIALLESDPDIAFVYSPIALCNSQGACYFVKRQHEHDVVRRGEEELEKALSILVMHSGPMMRMSAYRALGGYDSSVTFNVDTKLAVDLCSQGKVGYINRPLYAFHQHGTSLTRRTTVKYKLEEGLYIIEQALSGPLAPKISNPAALRHRVMGLRLLQDPTNFIFSGYYRAGWREFLTSLKLRPYETLLQKQTLALVARTLLGAGGYQALQTISARVRNRPQPALPVEV